MVLLHPSDGRFETDWSHHEVLLVYLRLIQIAATDATVADACQAPLVWADSADMPAIHLEARHGWRVRHLSGYVRRLGAHRPYQGGSAHAVLHRVKHGLPLRVLRFLIGVCGGPGLMVVDCGDESGDEVVRSGGAAVLAGWVHATTFMMFALVGPVDDALAYRRGCAEYEPVGGAATSASSRTALEARWRSRGLGGRVW